MSELSPENEKLALSVLTVLANRIDKIPGKPGGGFSVQHKESEKVGIAFHKEQDHTFQIIKKVLVNWEDGTRTLVSGDKLNHIGYVD